MIAKNIDIHFSPITVSSHTIVIGDLLWKKEMILFKPIFHTHMLS